MRIRLIITAALLAMYVLAAVPAFASDDAAVLAFTEEESTEAPSGEDGEEGVADITENDSGIVPVVEVEVPAADDTEAPWTERFLAPIVLTLGVLGVVGATAYYFVRVRGRYQVVG